MNQKLYSYAALTVFLIFFSQLLDEILSQTPINVPFKIVNKAGAPIETFWINIFENDKLLKQSEKPLRNNSIHTINSYEGHEFLFRFYDHKDGVEAKFKKGPREETVTLNYDPTTSKMSAKVTSKFDDLKEIISQAIDDCDSSGPNETSTCLANAVMDEFNRVLDSKNTLSKYFDIASHQLRNYTCADDQINTTDPIRTYDHVIDNNNYKVNVMFDTSHAKIWAVDDFITDEECDILESHGRPNLQRATVAAEDGSSVVSENRKAQQAGYAINPDNPSEDPLYPLYMRILGLTNHHVDHFNLKPEGQEDFTIIQYNVDDQYTPHCDGNCDNSPHIPTGRVATAVLYCKAPSKGGATAFSKANVIVRPKRGSATFFSYKGPDGRMDEGFTEHSGCPVLEGEKLITTFWMREGVDINHPWVKFDPSGIEILAAPEKQETEVEAN